MTPPLPRRKPPLLLVGLSLVALAPCAFAAKPGKEEKRAAKREAAAAGTDATTPAPADNSEGNGKAGAANNQARLMERLRAKLEVPDDAEWSVIAARVARVEELQRSQWASGPNNRGGINLGDKKKPGASADADREALRAAVTDKLPEAEIKSRLSRAHDVQRQNEAQLAQAQQELRSVLTVRQEATAVLAGLLPP